MSARALVLVGALALAATACGGHERDERVDTARSAVVGGEVSTAAEDFVVFVSHASTNFTCGGTLVAPNLVLTAKHCVFKFPLTESLCDASGEPQVGSNGGFVTGPIPLGEIGIYAGADGRKRFDDGEPPAAVAKQIVDDGTPTLCSHDLAYVVLDRPITTTPIGRLRLGKRPEPSSFVTLAGWGKIDYRLDTGIRMRRTGIGIQRVGPPAPLPDSAGSLGPRLFETGPGACTGDSGSPAFDPQSGAILGVLARGTNLDDADPVSPCRPDTVTNVYMTVNDFPKPLREAFAAASAEPWMEGRPAAGWLRYGDACTADLECEGELCAGGTCNVDCAKPGRLCPSGYACGASGRCESAAAADAGAPPPDGSAPTNAAPPADPGGCATGKVPSRAGFPYLAVAGALVVVLARRRRCS